MKLFGVLFIFSMMMFVPRVQGQQIPNSDNLSQTLLDDTERVNRLLNLAASYFFKNPDTSLLFSNKAIELAHKIHFSMAEYSGLNGAGAALRFLGDYPEALEMQFRALEICKNIRDKAGEAITMGMIGNTYSDLNEYRQALDWLYPAYRINDSLYDKLMATVELSSIGNTYEKMNMLDSALIIQLQARANSVVIGMKNLKGTTLARIGVVMFRLGRYNEALSYFRDAFIQTKISGNKLDLSFIQYGMANAYLSLMKTDSSLYHARMAYSEGMNQSQKLEIFEASNLLIKIFLLTGQKDSIIYYQGIAIAMKDNLFGREKLRQYQLFTLKQLQQQHKQNLDTKNKEIAISKLEVANQRKTQFGLIFGLALLGIIGGLLSWQSRMRKKSNTTLMVLNNQLDEANKVKAKFFGILTHDLRSPISSLINFLNLLKNEPELISANEQLLFQKHIGQSAEELLQTMETMLIWSKEQMDNFQPDIRILPVQDLFDYLHKFFTQTTQAQISFSNPEALEVSGDENYLKVIMQNLTDNAIKVLRNNPNGTINWKACKVGIKTILSINDNGPGISAEQMKALYNNDSVVNAKSGFGFYLIRDLAKAIQYQITIESNPGMGTTFILSS